MSSIWRLILKEFKNYGGMLQKLLTVTGTRACSNKSMEYGIWRVVVTAWCRIILEKLYSLQDEIYVMDHVDLSALHQQLHTRLVNTFRAFKDAKV